MDYDQTTVPESYDAGREISDDKKREFIARFAQTIGTDAVDKIIDLGCGTGRFSGALADIFDANVLGVEPSSKMIERARAKHNDVRLRFHDAPGEALPVDDSSVDMIFMSMVLHHLAAPQKVALECWRALRSGGHVCIRNTVSDEVRSYPYLDVFPSIQAIIKRQLISRERLNGMFEELGFRVLAGETIWHEIAPNGHAFAEKIALRADSFVAQLPDREFEAGVEALRERALTAPEAVGLRVDLIVYELE
ncbi:MAG: methyltransferase domain-containing protein [Alphaproteobacteria bacterium]|nr:methyltransferase domain-containing protein [Alphaproteobacteria bacterium]